MARVIMAHSGPKITDPKAGRVAINCDRARISTRDLMPILATNLRGERYILNCRGRDFAASNFKIFICISKF